MSGKRRWRRAAGAIGAVAVLCVAGDVAALTSRSFKYASEQTGYYSIAPMALSPHDTGTLTSPFSEYRNRASQGVLNGAGCYSVGVRLPQGARLVQVDFWHGGVAGDFTTLSFVEMDLSSGDMSTLVDVSVPSPNPREKATFQVDGDRKIDNRKKSYPFWICLDRTARFHGARITYGFRNAGD